jgi:hypothetical protein
VLRRTKKSRKGKFRLSDRPKGGFKGKWVTFKPSIGPAVSGPMSLKWITLKAFSDPVPPDRYEGALDQINTWRGCNGLPPLAGEDLEKCEQDVVTAVRSVGSFKEWAPFVAAPKWCKTKFEAEARARRKAARSLSEEPRRLLEEEAAVWDRRAAVKQPRIGSFGRDHAARSAEQILTRFGGKAPGLRVGGPWQELSEILFDVEGADMFEAMRRCRRASRP